VKLEYTALILLIIQLVVLSWVFVLNPVIDQTVSALLMSLNFIITALLLYIYGNRGRIYPSRVLELDEEWLAIGVAIVILIILIVFFV